MLYSGHFSFDEVKTQDTERHGYFSCIVQAATPELALLKFKKRIQTVKEDMKESLFENITAVYVEDLVEISERPEEAIITRFQSSEGPFPKSISCSLPTSDTKKIKAFQWVPETEKTLPRDQRNAGEGYKIATPFLDFFDTGIRS